MKIAIPTIALIAILWLWIPGSGSVPSPIPDGSVSAVAHDAGINFLKLLGEEFQAASTLDAKSAFERIEDRQVTLRQSVLFKPLGEIANKAAYSADGSGEFNQQRFTEAMQQVASGLKAVR